MRICQGIGESWKGLERGMARAEGITGHIAQTLLQVGIDLQVRACSDSLGPERLIAPCRSTFSWFFQKGGMLAPQVGDLMEQDEHLIPPRPLEEVGIDEDLACAATGERGGIGEDMCGTLESLHKFWILLIESPIPRC